MNDQMRFALDKLWEQYDAIKDAKDELWLNINRIEKMLRDEA